MLTQSGTQFLPARFIGETAFNESLNKWASWTEGTQTEGRTDGRTDRFPVFYRTSSPSGPPPKKLDYDQKEWEALKIKKENCGPGKGMNEDWGSYVKTDAWNPVFNTMD